eukprot:6765133-Karenia_brevis.AAC.1
MDLKAACPEPKESATIDLFKLYTNMGGKGIFERSSTFTDGDIIRIIKDMINQSKHAAWLLLHRILRTEIRLVNPIPMFAHFQG